MPDSRRSWIVDSLAIFFLTAILIGPLFKLVYLNRWPSIESTFIADGRMMAENLPHRNWQPLWYCGTRADYVYPPGVRYGTAILSKALHTSPARGYHLYIALLYCLGIVAIYFLVRVGNGSRGFAWLAAAASALLSPSFLFLPLIRHDAVFLAPQRLHVLIDYGEGPHISALSILPFVFAAMLLAVRRGSLAWVAVAGVAAAAVVTNNFYGLTALAILFPILAWACFLARPNWRVLVYFSTAAVLAYGLTAWWLAPSYVLVTSRNLKLVAEPGNMRSVVVLAVIVLVFLVVTLELAARVRSAYQFFVWGGCLFLSLYILGHVYFQFQVAGDSNRLVPELDLFLILVCIEVLRWMWSARPRRLPAWVPRACAVAAVLACYWPAAYYVKRAYKLFPEDHAWRDGVEYRTANWMHENLPGQRALTTGSIRFWYDAWHNLPQMDGGSQQGLLNSNVVTAQWRIVRGGDMELTRLWLQAMAVDAAIVPEKASKEIYHDFSGKIAGLWRTTFPILRDDGEGNIYYRIDRRVPGIARIVDSTRMRGLAPIPDQAENAPLRAYVDAIEAEPVAGDSRRRLRITRPNTDEIHLESSLAQSEAILVQETYDPGWHAYDGGQPVQIDKDPVGFMLLDLRPGTHNIVLAFEPTLEMNAGRTLTCVTIILVMGLFVIEYRRRISHGGTRDPWSRALRPY